MNVVAPKDIRRRGTRRFPAAVGRGVRYAEDVVSGHVPACRYVRLAAQRFLGDLDASEAGRGRWAFDAELADLPRQFIEALRNYKGPLAGTNLALMPWQIFILINLFGFIDRKSGFRRFHQAVIYVPKGNGKTCLAAGIALYMTFAEGEGGAEGYSAAVSREQASLMFNDAKQMALQCPELLQDLGLGVNARTLYQDVTASRLTALSSQAKSLDGKNVHVAVCDEIASHRTSGVYSALQTAIGKRSQPLLLSISTATDNTAGIGKILWDDCVSLLEGVVQDDRLFALIYTIDLKDQTSEGDPVHQEATWRKANPGWGVTVQPDAFRSLAAQAARSAAHEADFKTKNLNVWTAALNPLFSMASWAACHDPALKIEDMWGKDCFIGLDLASRQDLACAVLVFPERSSDINLRYKVFAQFYINEAALTDPEGRKNAMYAQWVDDGWLIATPGNETDFGFIEADILAFASRVKIQDVPFDPWNAVQFAQRLEASRIKTVEFRQNVANYSAPTKELSSAMNAGRIAHDGNPVLAWCISNVVGRYDANDNVFPRKVDGRNEKKIDGAIGLIQAIGRAMVAWRGPSVYETRGLTTIGASDGQQTPRPSSR